MLLHSFQRLSPVIFGLAFLALTGCATTLLYNHADWLIARQLDGYFDLSRSQKRFVSARLDSILDRHRREALPRYESVLQQVEARVRRGLADNDMEWAFAQYDQLKTDLFARFAPDGAEFIRLVREPQVSRLKISLRQRLAREEGLLHDSALVRQAKRSERLIGIATDWLGSLTQAQEQEITRLTMNFPDSLPAWYSHQTRRNNELVAIVETRHDPRTKERLSQWLIDQEKDADPQFLLAATQLRHHTATLILAIDHMATPEQRRHVIAKLEELATTIHALSQT